MQEKRKRNEKQIREVILLNRQFQDLNPLFFGYEICKKGYKYGPAIRKYTLIHYVVEGNSTNIITSAVVTVISVVTKNKNCILGKF